MDLSDVGFVDYLGDAPLPLLCQMRQAGEISNNFRNRWDDQYFLMYSGGKEVFCCMLEISFDVMQSAAIAALVAMVGRAIVKRVKFFQTYCVPGVVVAGLIVSIVLAILRTSNVLIVNFDVAVLKEWFMDIFFTGVGLTASWKLIKQGGKVCIGIAVATIGLILWQDVLGVVMAMAFGMHPLQGLGLGSLSLMGGVGTSSAIAPTYEALGAENATVLAVMCATFGMVFASLTGGPVARALIKKHNLHGEDRAEQEQEEVFPLNNKKLLSSVCLIIISAGLGSYIAIGAGYIPMIEFPYFIGCMIGGIIVRNILDVIHVEVRAEELDAFGDICLEIFLGMTMMTIDVTKILGAVGPFVAIFAAQVITTCIFCYIVTFRCCGSNYDAAVIVAGHIGMGLGNGPNTMANEKAVMAEHGFSRVGWVVYPPFGLLVLDVFNPIFCSVIAEPLTKALGYMPAG